MKSFLKLIVSIIVILVIGVTVYFLLNNMEEYNKQNESGEKIDNVISENLEENNNEQSNNDNQTNNEQDVDNEKDEYINQNNNISVSGENADFIVSGELTNENVSEEVGISEQLDTETINQTINKANTIKNQNNNAPVSNLLEDNVGVDIIGSEYQELLNMLNSNTLTVNVQTAGTMIYILPMSDFVNNQQYHYDENGNLVLYINELMGIGGEIKYYFYNNQLIKTEETVEGELFIEYEDVSQILQKSKQVYDKYFKQ